MSTSAILTVLSNIPWGQVIENAPRVADGATKLWNSVTGFRKAKAKGEPVKVDGNEVEPSGNELLRTQVEALQDSVQTLQQQMQDSSELIKALAEQNTQLVARIELNRVRMLRIAVGAMVAVILLAAAVTYLALRQ
jgi:hypothetical protein